MSYTNYISGTPNGTAGQSGSYYNLLVSGGNDYTAASGVMIKNDITSSSTGKTGTRIFQDSSDNAWVDFRTTATDGSKSIAFRLQDDNNPTLAPATMLNLTKDTKASTSVYAASITGRVQASQFAVTDVDTRVPSSAGVYMGQDSTHQAYMKINPGVGGTGGFKFQTTDQNGANPIVNLTLNAAGSVLAPYYQATGDTQDSETTAIASFDSTGLLVRDYSQNKKIRDLQTSLARSISQSTQQLSNKINELVTRFNGLRVYNNPIISLPISTPAATLVTGEYAQIDFGATTAYPVVTYIITRSGSSYPTAWVLAGSNDGTSWYSVDAQNNQTPPTDTNVTAANALSTYTGTQSLGSFAANAFRYYRFIIQKISSGSTISLASVYLFGVLSAVLNASSANTATLSSGLTAANSPNFITNHTSATLNSYTCSQYSNGGAYGGTVSTNVFG